MMELKTEQKTTWMNEVCRWHGWLPLGLAAVVIAVGIFLLKPEQDPDRGAPTGPLTAVSDAAGAPSVSDVSPWTMKSIPMLLHSVTLGEESGQLVFIIRVTPDGDELIVDATTGKLVSIREGTATTGPKLHPLRRGMRAS